jgi:KDO2-lipid IV(A) lauroyltransferase
MLALLAWLLVPLLPRFLIVRLARGLGTLGWFFSPSLQRIADANLQVVFGETMTPAHRREIVRASFQSFALTMLDVFWFMRNTRHRIARYVRVDDSFLPLFERRPLIACTGHLGNWEIMSTLCGLRGAPVTAVAMPLKNAFADRVLNRLRRSTGSKAVPRQGAVRALLKSLKENRSIALVIDQNTRPAEGGFFTTFLGLSAPVTNAPGMLWQRTGAPVIVVDCTADKNGIYTARGSVLFPADDEHAVSSEAVTKQAIALLEDVIRERPEHWLWSYKRWRYIVDEAAGDYPFYAKPYREGS